MNPPSGWSPSRPVFLRRIAVNAALTFVIVLALLLVLTLFWQTSALLALFLAGIATIAGLSDDLIRWRRLRDEHWQVEGAQLLHDGPEGHAMISLSEIDTVTTRVGGAVMIRLTSGKRILMRYLEGPEDVIASLNAARGA